MSDLATMMKDSVSRLFREQVSREFLHSRDESSWAADLWNLSEDLGLGLVLVSEVNGGVGGDWEDAYEIISACGRFAVPLPIPENLAARWLVDQSEQEQPCGPLTLMAGESTARRVPWGRYAATACTTATNESGVELLMFDLGDLPIQQGTNLAQEPRDSFALTDVSCRRISMSLPADATTYLGAMLRSAQISGAAMTMLESAAQYTEERSQFGRPLIKFQTIQHYLARLATAAASLDAVSRTAFKAMDDIGFSDDPSRDVRFAIAAAKCRASNCVDLICRIAHQVHGAIGFTSEHSLHRFSRRAWSWRAEFGSAGFWADRLGQIALEQGGDATWQLITGLDSKQQTDSA